MPDARRRFRQHPIYSTIGALYATVLIGLTSLVWLGAIGRMIRRIDPETYARATKDMRFIAFVWSKRSAPAHRHNALIALDLNQYPASLRHHARFTVLLNATLLWTFCAVALGLLAKSILTSIRIA